MANKKEVTINKVVYEIYQLNALKQFHLLRKLLALVNLSADAENLNNAIVENLFKNIGELSDEQANKLLAEILQGVRRVDNEQRLTIFENNKIMYDDLQLFDLINLCKEVLTFNYENFTSINQLKSIK